MKQRITDIYWRSIEDSSIFANREIDFISLNFYTNMCVFKLSNLTTLRGLDPDYEPRFGRTYITPFCNYRYDNVANRWSFVVEHPIMKDVYIKVIIVITTLHPNGVIYTEPFKDELPIGFKEYCKNHTSLD